MKRILPFLMSLCMILMISNIEIDTASAQERNINAEVNNEVSAKTNVINENAEIPPTQFGKIENGEIVWQTAGSTDETELRNSTSFICDTYSLLVSATVSLLTGTVPSGTTVTWTSQNTDIATVNSNGVVTGIKAGTARINASVNDGSSTIVKQVSVYVIIEDGVYYIKNNATSKYLYVTNSAITENAGVTVSAKLTSDPARLPQLWKIKYLDEGCYSIRPMHKLDMCIGRLGTGVAIATRGIIENNSDIPALAQWRISATTSGYKLDSKSYPGNYLYVSGTSVSLGGATNNVWSLEKLSTAPSGVLLYNTKSWIEPESTATIVVAVYSGETLSQNVIWESSDSSVAYAGGSGIITTVSEGTTVITVKSAYNTSWSNSFTVNVGSVPNGTYYFRNKETSRYLDIDGPSTASGVDIHQWQYYGHDSQKWTIELQQDGYYTIKSVYSSLYLTVENNSTAQNARITQSSGGTASGQRWKFTRLETGGYKIGAKCGESTDKCLAVGDYLFNVDGLEVQHKTYTNPSNMQDEWYIGTQQIFIATVNNYYDKGYYVFYEETENNSKVKINSYAEDVCERYNELFGLQLYINDASYYLSPIDTCKGTVTLSNIDLLCSHSGTIHTDRGSVISAFNQQYNGNNKITNVYWSGHKIRSVAENGNQESNRSCSSGSSVIMIGRYTSNNRRINSKGVLMHELNHQYGAPDHYHVLADDNDPTSCVHKDICSECGNSPRPSTCIMNNSRIVINSENVICNDCKNEILNHLSNHH